jgi:hypothetical protein
MRRYYFDLLANTVAPSSNRGMECRYMQPSRKKLSARSPLWSGMQSARECSTNQMPIHVRDGGGRSCKSALQLRLRCPAYFRRAPHRRWRRVASRSRSRLQTCRRPSPNVSSLRLPRRSRRYPPVSAGSTRSSSKSSFAEERGRASTTRSSRLQFKRYRLRK